jgi:hypothetical protein
MGGDLMSNDNEQPQIPERTQLCTCRAGDLLENPSSRCAACGGDEERRF